MVGGWRRSAKGISRSVFPSTSTTRHPGTEYDNSKLFHFFWFRAQPWYDTNLRRDRVTGRYVRGAREEREREGGRELSNQGWKRGSDRVRRNPPVFL